MPPDRSSDRTLEDVSAPSRVAGEGEGIGRDELHLASRNHAMPLEALRADLTPPGLHYVLTHYDIPFVDAQAWRLRLAGGGGAPVELGLDDLRSRPQHTVRVTMECAGNGRAVLEPRPVSQPWLTGAVGTAEWTGVPLTDLLTELHPPGGATHVVFTGLDHGVERGVEQDYQRGLALDDEVIGHAVVALEMNGAPLPAQHGFPARLVVPGWYGMAHVKWLREISLQDSPFEGFQHHAYRLRAEADDPGTPVTRIEPRALLAPPGFPDFMSRTRVLRPGPVALEGRAWSGWGPVVRVEVSTDDGATWTDADLGAEAGRWAWRRFTAAWEATPGTHALRVRAHDATGRVQGTEPDWNRGGFTNNADLALEVVVLPAP
ncbi:sulfite oxidase [Nocardioides sp. GCM10027113]|uniref:sulfite oxidase n=1 Tax=unclassified Nocardioides TaxID=2615069 RepID=UPI0036105B78